MARVEHRPAALGGKGGGGRPDMAQAGGPDATKGDAAIAAIEQAYRLLLRSKLNTTQAVAKMKGTLGGSPDGGELLGVIAAAERGVTK